MRRDLPFAEPLARRLPLPLARLYRRAHHAKNPLDQCLGAYYLWEAGLKLLASVAVTLYAERGEPDPALAECLQNLARPSLGHWWDFVRRITPVLAGAGDRPFAEVRSLVLGPARADLPRAAELDAALREEFHDRGAARGSVCVKELFDRLVTFRNRTIGHGAAGQRPAAFYERFGQALFLAVPELLERLDVLAGRRLVYVPEVRLQPDGTWLVERHELLGETAHRLTSLERPEGDRAQLPRPECLYLQAAAPSPAGGEAVTLVSLHPLVVCDPENGEVLFLNSRRGARRIEYLCYTNGRLGERAELLHERRDLLARALAMPVDDAAVEGMAARSQAEELAEGLAPAPPAGQPPRQLGEFELLSELGRGGMGVVYKARQPSLGRQVALKKLFHSGDAKAEQRFQREIRALGRVEHPNLVKIFTSGSDGDQWFYAMELLDGATLSAVCERLGADTTAPIALDWPTWQGALSTVCEEARRQEKPLDGAGAEAPPATEPHVRASLAGWGGPEMGRSYPRHIVGLVRQVAEAAHALHSVGVIHRDIKPGNIMVSPDGSQAVLMDLGLAQLVDDVEGRLTRTRQFVGTLRYASPEQVLAVGGLDCRSDVYSLGASLWELLTLRPMFGATAGTNEAELMRRIQVEEPERPRKYHPGLPRDLEAVVLKCLEKAPQRRYATAAELADELRRVLDGEPVRARRVSQVERSWRWCRRNPARVALAGLSLLAAVASVALLIGSLFAAQQARSTKALREEKDKTDAALTEAKEQKRLADQYRGEAERLSALLILEKGDALCEEGDAGRGILWIARSLAVCPESAPYVRRRIRTALPSAAATLHTLEAAFWYPNQTATAAFSPDGKTLLLGGKGACLVDVGTGRKWAEQPSAKGVTSGDFSPDGNLFVTATMGGDVRVADTSTGKDVGLAITHKGIVRSVAFSPDGKTLLVAARDGTSLRCYDVETRRPVGPTFPCKDNLYMAAYSPDGRRLVTAAQENNACLWDTATGERIGEPLVHPGVVFTAAFSPDGRTVVTGCLDGGVRFWEVESRKSVRPVLWHNKAVRGTVFSRDGRLVLTSSEDGTARLWEAATGRTVGQLLSHPSQLSTAVFSPDQAHILTAGYEGTARLWRLAREQALAKVLPHPGAVAAAAFSRDGKQVLTGCEESANRPGESRLWDAATGAALGPAMSQQGQVMAVAFSPDGKQVLTGGNDGTARLWNSANSSPAQAPWSYGSIVAATAFSPDGRLVAIGGRRGSVELRDVAGGKVVAAWEAYDPKDGWVWSVAFTPDGRTLLTGGGMAGRLWSVPDGRPIGQPMRHDLEARTALLSPDGQVVLTCSHDQTARLWSARDSQPLSPPLVHKGRVVAGAFRPDGKVVATATADGTLRLWEVPGGRSLMPPLLHDGWVRSVAFSPDGKTLVSGCDDGTARLWSADDGTALGAVLRHRGPVNRVAFSPDGKTVLTASNDGTARLWTPPPPVRGDAAHIALWIQVLTGMELEAEGTVQVLTADAWQQRRRQLQERGGAPPSEP